MIIETGRFGKVTVGDNERISIPQGILGFPEDHNYCLIDSADDTLILWLQSLDHPNVAFPVLEPKIFKPEYFARLSQLELRELKLENINQSAVFSILTIPEDVRQMSANLKAPIVINLKEQIAKQVILQENEYNIKHPMFNELKTHLMTIGAQRNISSGKSDTVATTGTYGSGAISVNSIPPSMTVKSLIV